MIGWYLRFTQGSSFVKNFDATLREIVTRCSIPVILQLDTNGEGSQDVITAVLRLTVGCVRTYPTLMTIITGKHLHESSPYHPLELCFLIHFDNGRTCWIG
jgi:hypothetical protein